MSLLRCLFIAFVLASPAHASGDHAPKHGGIVAETKDYDVELVARPDSVRLFVRGHDGRPADVAGGSAKLTLLAGKEKQEAELKPAGDALAAKGSFKAGAGAKAVVVVSLPGKPAFTARFALK